MKYRFPAGGVIALLSIAGCWHTELYQDDVCVQPRVDAGPASPTSCPTREQVLSNSSVDGSATCDDHADPIVSVDEGPVVRTDAGVADWDCCYLATFRTKYCLPE